MITDFPSVKVIGRVNPNRIIAVHMWYIVPFEVLQDGLDKGKSIGIRSLSIESEEVVGGDKKISI